MVRKKKVQQVLVLARLFRLPLAQKLRHPARLVLLLRLAIDLLQKAVGQSGQVEASASQQQSTVEAPQAQQTQPQQASGRQNTQNQATQPAQASESNRQLQNKQAASNARYKGVLTMVDGDFSAAAGTWKDANGNTVTVSGNGQFTVQSADGKTANYSIASYSYTLDDGKYNAQLSGQGNANLQITTGADGSVTSVVVTQP